MLGSRLRRQCCLCKSAHNTLKHASLVVTPAPEPARRPWRVARTRTSAPPKPLLLTGSSGPAGAAGAGDEEPYSDVGAAGERWQPQRRSYHCRACGRAFRYACNLRAHAAHHGRAPVAAYSCPDCRAAFPRAHLLTDHLREHAILQQQVELQEQVARQLEEQMVMQQQLEEQFLIQQAYIAETAFGSSLGLGWGSAAQPTPIRCACLECGREFLQRSALRQHMKEHGRAASKGERHRRSPPRRRRAGHPRGHGVPPAAAAPPTPTPTPPSSFFRCGCGKHFDSPVTLHSHSATHVRRKPFQCSQCPADFSNPWNLARHYKEHLRHLCVLSLGDLRCGVCNENFRSDELELRRHKALHKDVRLCRCGRCGARFRNGWDWEQHVGQCDKPVT